MKIILFLSVLLSSTVQAIEFNIHNICDNGLFLSEEITVLLDSNVSDITLYALDINQIDFIGSEYGISSMLGTPTGLDSYEVIDENHMLAYGWCYSVDGIAPDQLMNEYPIIPNIHHQISWFYGYAEIKDGEWLSYCTPVSQNPRSFICKK